MSYTFRQSRVASAKIVDFNGTTGNTFNLYGVNGTVRADSLVAGITQLLDIAGMSRAFEPENIVRVINQSVVEGVEPDSDNPPTITIGDFTKQSTGQDINAYYVAPITYDGSGTLFVNVNDNYAAGFVSNNVYVYLPQNDSGNPSTESVTVKIMSSDGGTATKNFTFYPSKS